MSTAPGPEADPAARPPAGDPAARAPESDPDARASGAHPHAPDADPAARGTDPDTDTGTEPVDAQRRLTVLAGPTAVGKGTVSAAVRRLYPQVWLSVSVTTRAPRRGEVDGVHYHFVDDAEFDRMVAAGELLEWAVVHRRARYGTPRRAVEEALEQGRAALLEIDLQGARQVRQS
ncbi:MAG TPA: hypothetical protein VKB14_04725, partial [Actinomycetales bacterium]|nr:hypothetical protein [Actinomycetales bacterium]